jgi:receptor expression-enhancing protein 1/2/3/4
MPYQGGSSGYSRIPESASEQDLRARVSQYEEVEVPSDVEGYDAGPALPRRPAVNDAGRRTSFFGWGFQGSDAEKAKDE